METQVILRKDVITFCTLEDECNFKKLVAKKNGRQTKARYPICTWKDHCNQQNDHPDAILPRLMFRKKLEVL